MTNPSCIRSTFRIQKTLQCTCNVYKFPHSLGYGDCKSSINSPAEFSPPKKGLASKLVTFLDDLEEEILSLNKEEIHSISELIIKFKKHLT